MGDHIVCNGLVRSILNDGKYYSDVYVFAKQSNADRVSRMFDDDPRIHVLTVPSNQNEVVFVNHVVAQYGICDFLRCGFGFIENLCSINPKMNYDEAMYSSCGIPFDNRWKKFSLRRDTKLENDVLNKLNPSNEDFIFVHDDPSRGFCFEPTNTNNTKIIRNDPTVGLFDMIGVLTNAKEIHCMESSFRALIDHIEEIRCPLYFYKKVREDVNGSALISTVRKNWTVI
jgi:hypothetical protein